MRGNLLLLDFCENENLQFTHHVIRGQSLAALAVPRVKIRIIITTGNYQVFTIHQALFFFSNPHIHPQMKQALLASPVHR